MRRNSVTGSGTPLSAWLPRSSATNRPATLPLHPRRDHDRTRLGQCLRPSRDVRHVAENLARRIDHHRPRLDGDACGKPGLPATGVLAVQLGQRALDRKRRPHCTLGIVLLRHRVAEQRHQAVAELLGDLAAHLRHCRRSGIEIRTNQIAPLFGIEPCGNAGRVHQIAEQDRDVPALAGSFRSFSCCRAP